MVSYWHHLSVCSRKVPICPFRHSSHKTHRKTNRNANNCRDTSLHRVAVDISYLCIQSAAWCNEFVINTSGYRDRTVTFTVPAIHVGILVAKHRHCSVILWEKRLSRLVCMVAVCLLFSTQMWTIARHIFYPLTHEMFILENIITLVIATYSDIEAGNCGHSGGKTKKNRWVAAETDHP